MITYHDALEKLINVASTISSVWVDGVSAVKRILAEDIVSPMDSPCFNQSAMDGYALCAEETSFANQENPIDFTIAGIIPAGFAGNYFGKQTAVKIMTGAPVPLGYDAVLPVEEANIRKDKSLVITSAVALGRNIRLSGEDIKKGELLFSAGDEITPHMLMICATVGIHRFRVKRKLNIVHLSTGQEIIDYSSKALDPGKIHNSNAPFLHSELTTAGHSTKYLGQIKDDPETFQACLNVMLQKPPDIIISTGAVSKGDFDFIPAVLKELGADIIFHGVAMRPGKPILAAKFGKTLFFGLPGNPIAAAVGYYFFIQPFIHALLGKKTNPPLMAKLNTPIQNKKQGWQQFLKATAYIDKDNSLCVDVLAGQESSKVKPLIKANAWVMLSEQATCAHLGESVQLMLTGVVKNDT